MTAEGHTVASLTGAVEGSVRDRVIDDFREGRAKVLITTNVLARGIDVSTVSMVINYVCYHISKPTDLVLTLLGYPRTSQTRSTTHGRPPDISPPYRSYRPFWSCRRSHFLRLQQGRMADVNEHFEVLQH